MCYHWRDIGHCMFKKTKRVRVNDVSDSSMLGGVIAYIQKFMVYFKLHKNI